MSTCTPATTYFFIALVICTITIIIQIIHSGGNINPFQIGSMSCSQLCSILICTSILGYICQQLSVTVTWIIVGIWIACIVSGCVSASLRITQIV